MMLNEQIISCRTLISVALSAFLALGCSGSQQDDEQFSNQYNENSAEDSGEDDQYSGDQYAANGAGDEGGGDAGGGDEYAADVNNDTSADTDEYAEVDVPENTATDTVNGTLDNSGGGTDYATPVSTPMENTAMMAPPPSTAPPPNSATAPIPGGRVRYARTGGTQIMNSPGGSPVGVLSQGDHPVTWDDNGWLRITQGMYVSPDTMSDKGVGRSAAPASW